jgi:uncharacterized protein YggE
VNPAILSSVQSRTLALAVAALAWGRPALAQGQRVSIDAALHTSDKPYAAGEATVSAKPGQAVIEIGVVSQASNANAASTQKAKQTDAVLAELNALLSSGKKVRTTSYSVRPNLQYLKPGAANPQSAVTPPQTLWR